LWALAKRIKGTMPEIFLFASLGTLRGGEYKIHRFFRRKRLITRGETKVKL